MYCAEWWCSGSFLALSARLSPVSAPTRRRICAVASAAGTSGGWCLGSSGCRRPAAQHRRPPTPPLPPAVTSCPLDTSGGRCHSGSGCSEQLGGETNDRMRSDNCSAHPWFQIISTVNRFGWKLLNSEPRYGSGICLDINILVLLLPKRRHIICLMLLQINFTWIQGDFQLLHNLLFPALLMTFASVNHTGCNTTIDPLGGSRHGYMSKKGQLIADNKEEFIVMSCQMTPGKNEDAQSLNL